MRGRLCALAVEAGLEAAICDPLDSDLQAAMAASFVSLGKSKKEKTIRLGPRSSL